MRQSTEHHSLGGLLIIDTSLQGVGIGIVLTQDGTTTPVTPGNSSLAWHQGHFTHAGSLEVISELVTSGLNATELRMQDIRGIAVSVGPGSFTGIKIGLAYAYGLALGALHPIPFLGISSLAAAARISANQLRQGLSGPRPPSPQPQGGVLFIPATRTHGFMAKYSIGLPSRPGTPSVDPPMLIDLTTEDAHKFEQFKDLNLSVMGPWPRLTELARLYDLKLSILNHEDVCQLALQGMAELAAEAWPGGFTLEKPNPSYLRLSTAEEKQINPTHNIQEAT